MEPGSALGVRPSILLGTRRRPPPRAELPWLTGFEGPVLLQDASVLKSIKGISKQITW